MKEKNTLFTIAFLFLLSITDLQADVKGTMRLEEKAAGCMPGSSFAELSIAGVRARINSGGDMWWDLIGVRTYEVPKGSGRHSMFAGAIWISGEDYNGNRKIAAQRYRDTGVDFWPGPLTVDGSAAIEADGCLAWDRVFTILRADAENHRDYYENQTSIANYVTPSYFYDYPAHGDASQGQSHYLAPFYDSNEDGIYNPDDGDYPLYDLDNVFCGSGIPSVESNEGITSRGLLENQCLKGDQTLWWVFNDRGNLHGESGGESIGLEVRAQAFAFETGNQIGNATFYSFEIINRSNQTLYDSYVAMFTDADVGGSKDDYIGCDILRGLGYCYNGDDYDEDADGSLGYYGQPAAIGVDFLQGPYMDADGVDNGRFEIVDDGTGATIVYNCNEAVNGSGFGNGITDDERFGMQIFLGFNASGVVPYYGTPPEIAGDYYNFMRGYWKDNTQMIYGGGGHVSTGGYGPECRYMFPGLSDPCNYGTNGIEPNGEKNWTEQTAGMYPYDRRFMQSAGPFSMEPGEVNYLTVAIPWARSVIGGSADAVDQLLQADDKCQRLFDHCFHMPAGPDAPNVSIQELHQEVILYLENSLTSNNYQDAYEEYDPMITGADTTHEDSVYRFEGYQVYQVVGTDVSLNDVYDPSKARLIAQCDVKNDIGRIINYVYDSQLDMLVPREEVDGANEGIVHSFRVVEDAFDEDSEKKLIDNRKYYFMVVAYAFNEYEKFSSDPAMQFPGEISVNGQQQPYLCGKRNIQIYTAIPHRVEPEEQGTSVISQWGDPFSITRIEGQGNGGHFLKLTTESRLRIATDTFSAELTYQAGFGPIEAYVIDPLNVIEANYVVRLDELPDGDYEWMLDMFDFSGNLMTTCSSDHSISTPFDQVFPELGIALKIQQTLAAGDQSQPMLGYLGSEKYYENSSHQWLGGVSDLDEPNAYNWIRSGTQIDEYYIYNDYSDAGIFIDPNEDFENMLSGTWAPYRLVATGENGPAYANAFITLAKLEYLPGVDVVFTSDKSLWSRCPVIETCDDELLSEGNAVKMTLRNHASVDKNGSSGTPEAIYDGFITGMGWFPGYAVNVETGERLNIAFGEDSWLGSENGNDMILNPTAATEALNQVLFGGKHFIYVFDHRGDDVSTDMPAYDEGRWMHDQLASGTMTNLRNVYRAALYVSIPLAVDGETWLSNECIVSLRVTSPLKNNYSTFGASVPENNNYPMYRFSTMGYAAVVRDEATMKEALELINVVPNPYYAMGAYEEDVTENRIKITNLPPTCTIRIFTVDGTLIRHFDRNNEVFTWQDWDLKNTAGKRISGGLYLIHIDVPGIGTKSLKWFGSLGTITTNDF